MRKSRDYAWQAVRVRELAATTDDPRLRQQLVVIAEDYDHMADVESRIDRARSSVASRLEVLR